jgi:membrane protein DedA with SNARE-associated domain
MAVLVIAATAFAESFAFVSFFVPGFTILVAAGALVQTGTIDPVSAAVAGASGALIGDICSYAIGRRFGNALPHVWPFRKHPGALEHGVTFFKKWGWPSVFIGRFFGPLRAFVPLAAGICRMRPWVFYLTSAISAAIWAPALLYSGYLLGVVVQNGWTLEEKVAVFGGAALFLFLVTWISRRMFRA